MFLEIVGMTSQKTDSIHEFLTRENTPDLGIWASKTLNIEVDDGSVRQKEIDIRPSNRNKFYHGSELETFGLEFIGHLIVEGMV
jgi:hypothetical protein